MKRCEGGGCGEKKQPQDSQTREQEQSYNETHKTQSKKIQIDLERDKAKHSTQIDDRGIIPPTVPTAGPHAPRHDTDDRSAPRHTCTPHTDGPHGTLTPRQRQARLTGRSILPLTAKVLKARIPQCCTSALPLCAPIAATTASTPPFWAIATWLSAGHAMQQARKNTRQINKVCQHMYTHNNGN